MEEAEQAKENTPITGARSEARATAAVNSPQIVPPQIPKPSFAVVLKGNRDTAKGWELKYVKPTCEDGVVEITQEEWDEGIEDCECS